MKFVRQPDSGRSRSNQRVLLAPTDMTDDSRPVVWHRPASSLSRAARTSSMEGAAIISECEYALSFTSDMPLVLLEGGFAVRIYLNDHPPAHVHVLNAGGEARIMLEPVRVDAVWT